MNVSTFAQTHKMKTMALNVNFVYPPLDFLDLDDLVRINRAWL